MFTCPTCKQAFEKFVSLRAHVGIHDLLGQFKFPFPCGQEKCCRNFSTKKEWCRHVRNGHSIPGLSLEFENPQTGDQTDAQIFPFSSNLDEYGNDGVNPSGLSAQTSSTKEDLANSVAEQARFLVAELLANSSVTATITDLVVQACDSILEATLEYAKECIADFLCEQSIEVDTAELYEEISSLSGPLNDFKTAR